MPSAAQQRVPAGVTTGGQFAPGARPEPAGNLAAGDDEALAAHEAEGFTLLDSARGQATRNLLERLGLD